LKQLTAKDFKNKGRKKIKFEELDGYVFIKKLSVGEAFNFRNDDLSDEEKSHSMIMQSVIDEDGNHGFTTDEKVEASGLAEFKSLTAAILDYNGLSADKTEDLEKN